MGYTRLFIMLVAATLLLQAAAIAEEHTRTDTISLDRSKSFLFNDKAYGVSLESVRADGSVDIRVDRKSFDSVQEGETVETEHISVRVLGVERYVDVCVTEFGRTTCLDSGRLTLDETITLTADDFPFEITWISMIDERVRFQVNEMYTPGMQEGDREDISRRKSLKVNDITTFIEVEVTADESILEEEEFIAERRNRQVDDPRRTYLGPEAEACEGCLLNDECLDVGTQGVEDGVDVYCSTQGTLNAVRTDGRTCQNDFECDSNICEQGTCGAAEEEREQTLPDPGPQGEPQAEPRASRKEAHQLKGLSSRKKEGCSLRYARSSPRSSDRFITYDERVAD